MTSPDFPPATPLTTPPALLLALGQNTRRLRAGRGMSRKALAQASGLSERHLANLEQGRGNVSVLVLQQVASALATSMAELLGQSQPQGAEMALILSQLQGLDEPALARVREALNQFLAQSPAPDAAQRQRRVALVGLRGAGKSTLGQMLAQDLGVSFIELSREIEKLAGCSLSELQNLYGVQAYRRYERRALEEVIQLHSEVVIATPGGMTSELSTFNLLLNRCTTVWLKASAQDHMKRVMDQGDLRPMAGNLAEAMEDLKNILQAREKFYAQAQIHLDTSAHSLIESFELLSKSVRGAVAKLEPEAAVVDKVKK